MNIITIINIFITPSIVALLIFGIFLNLKYTEKNVYRHYLVSMLGFWAFLLTLVYAKFHLDHMNVISYANEVASVQILFMGIPCFISVVSYPIVILNASLLKFKSWFLIFLPFIIMLGIYFGWHYAAGVDPFMRYATYEDLFSNILSVSVILRLVTVLIFAIYIIAILSSIWQIVPLYNQYVQDNIADSDCNVDWIRTFVKYIAVVAVCYFAMFFFNSPHVNIVYLLSVFFLFLHVVDMSLFRKTSERINQLKIKRDYKRHVWCVDEDVPTQKVASDTPISVLAYNLDEWMTKEKPYTFIDFTTSDILSHFPDMTSYDLVEIFRIKGETFQSYVRRFRIYYACIMIDHNEDNSCLKQISKSVGFSHDSSFSRSFVSVVGLTPSKYSKCSDEEKEAIKANLSPKSPPPLRNAKRQ